MIQTILEILPENPPVSCIMPTYNRRPFVPQAIKYFLEQDYPDKELIIVDDGTDVIEDLVPDVPQIIYIPLHKKRSIGEKRNIAIEHSHADIILHWDDDDWHARHRIRYQVGELIRNDAEICGTPRLLFYDIRSHRLWRYDYLLQKRKWFAGQALCYTKDFWRERKFDDVNIGEDTRFLWKKMSNQMSTLKSYDFCVAMIHGNNVAQKSLSGSCWSERQDINIKDIVKTDWDFYSSFITHIDRPLVKRKALVAAASGIGDILRITPLIKVLDNMGYSVDILLSIDYPETATLFEDAPYIKKIFLKASKRSKQKAEQLDDLKKEQYDVAIYTIWSWPLRSMVNASRSLSFEYREWLKKGDTECVKKIITKLGWKEPMPRPFAVPSKRRFNLVPGTVALHPGCKPDWPWKKWHGFDELASILPEVVIVGTKDDMNNKNTYFQREFQWPDHAKLYIDSLNLADVAALLSQCSVLVSNDSGIMQLGATLGIPTFGIFGITDPKRETMPLENIVPITKKICDEYCRQLSWGSRNCRYDLKCLRTLSAQEVKEKIGKHLKLYDVPLKKKQENNKMEELKVKYYGYVFDASGYGNAARGYIHALNVAGVSLSVTNLSNNGKQVKDPLVESLIDKPICPDFHIFHGIPWGWERHLTNLSNTIAMTVWETDTMPHHWLRILNRVREVWLPSDFNISAFKQRLKVPLFKLPHALFSNGTNGQFREPKQLQGIAEDIFVFYSIFEWQDRKNPLGLIESYLRAMKGDEKTLLFIKTNPSAAQVAYKDLEKLYKKTASKAHVEICCEGWPDGEIESLHQRGDCYVSLHRGEGWGIPVFVAASKGKPIIATNYSGPIEFLNPDYHFLVRYQLTEVRQGYVYYHSRMHWAEPDVHHAAELIRWVNDNRGQAIEKAKKFAQKIKDEYSLDAVGRIARDHLLGLLNGNNASKRVNNKPNTNNIMPIPVPAKWYDKDYFDIGKKSNWLDGYKWSSFSGLFRETADLLCDTFLGVKSFLDVGCAKGFLIQTLREKGKIVQGFDHSSWAVNHALPSTKPYITCASVDNVQYTQKFDVLLALETFSHLTESQVRSFLLRAKCWINIGLFATIPTFETEEKVCEFKKQDKDPSHIMLKSREWWHALFLSTGWKQDKLHRILQDICQENRLAKNMKWDVYVYSVGE
ncbi:MAG: glycosyltransferase [Deltaproteobacteria bacterium]|nr:glycosyltransferase [Deltaproteobacteria bacterium]